MKIAIVTGHFFYKLGYQEYYFAEEFHRQKHDVQVFTTNHIPKVYRKAIGKKEYNIGNCRLGYNVCRYRPIISFGSTVISKPIEKDIRKFSPDLILFFGVRKIFGVDLLKKKYHNKYKIFSIFGDSLEYRLNYNIHKIIVSLIQNIFFILFKRKYYHKAIQLSDKILLTIPEAKDVIKKRTNIKFHKIFENKVRNIHLGFDQKTYYYDVNLRKTVRSRLNIGDNEKVFITVTRIDQSKKIEFIIDDIFFNKLFPIKYIIVGFTEGDYGNKIKAKISSLGLENNVICFEFVDNEKINELFNAADFGIWDKATISIIEAMGTGLPVVLKESPTVSHLINVKVNGLYYNYSNRRNLILQLVSMKFERKYIYEWNKKFSYFNLTKKIIELE